MKLAASAFQRYYAKYPKRPVVHVSATIPARSQSSILIESPISEKALDNAKPFEDIPGPKPLPIIGNLHRYLPVIGEYSRERYHESLHDKLEKYGTIVNEELVVGIRMVHLFDPKDIAIVFRHEGKYPHRQFFEALKHLREQKPQVYSTVGLAMSNGESWYQIRSRVQKIMMRPQVMKQYLPHMNHIADDAIDRIRRLRDEQNQVPELLNEFFKWSLESITYVLFHKRMGYLQNDLPPNSRGQQYINAVRQFLSATAHLEMMSLQIWKKFPSLSPAYKRMEAAHNYYFQFAREYAVEAMERLEANKDPKAAEETDRSLIELFLQNYGPDDASLTAIDTMAGAVETTSLTVAHVLRNLAANPESQQKLLNEIDHVLPNKKSLTADVLEDMPYLRACIKESMRISPVTTGVLRVLDRDIVLSGYRIPANTLVSMHTGISAVQEDNFVDAKKYIPERWLRQCPSKYSASDSFAFQPFGYGPRMCVGRRIADLEILALTTKIMQNFWVENKHHEVDISFELVLMIKSPLRIEFYDR